MKLDNFEKLMLGFFAGVFVFLFIILLTLTPNPYGQQTGTIIGSYQTSNQYKNYGYIVRLDNGQNVTVVIGCNLLQNGNSVTVAKPIIDLGNWQITSNLPAGC